MEESEASRSAILAGCAGVFCFRVPENERRNTMRKVLLGNGGKSVITVSLRSIVGIIFLLLVVALPVSAKQLERGRFGTLGCGATHRVRTFTGGTELRSTGISFSNFNTKSTITIDEIIIFDALGNSLATLSDYDFRLDHGAVLCPRCGTRLDLREAFGTSPGGAPSPSQSPIRVIVNWSSATSGGLDLFAYSSIRDRTKDRSIKETMSRGILWCVKLN